MKLIVGGRRWRKRTAVFALLAILLQTVGWSTASAAPPEEGGETEKVIVVFEGKPGKAGRDAIEEAGGKPGRSLPIASAIAAEVPDDGIAKLKKNPNVKAIEPDAPLVLFDHPAESQGAEYDAAWGVEHYGADDVHAAGNTGAGINVAVIDSGVDYNHPELDGPYVDGVDLFNNDDDPMDDNGHGTHVSGTIAAELNGQQVAGAAPGVNLYAVKVVDGAGNGDYSNLIAGLNWVHAFNLANGHGIDVVNMSLGGDVASAALETAINVVYGDGTIVVAASGNINPLNWQEIFFGCAVKYPAAYLNVWATSFTGPTDDLTGYSCTGTQIDFASPGDNIQSTVPTGSCMFCAPGGTNWLSGTSMASPHLAAAAALVLAHGVSNAGDPATLADDVKAHLCATTNPGTHFPTTDSRYPLWFGCGVVDVENALVINPPGGTPTPTPTPAPTPTPSATPTPTPAPSPSPTPMPTPAPSPTPPPGPTPTPLATVHVGDLDATATATGKTWTARVTVTAHSNTESTVANAAVLGSWGGLTGTCTTNSGGRCTIQLTKIPSGQSSITFTVIGVSATGRIYAGSANHDVDGSSTGTSITVNHP
jgi:subtilisin family serine protease